MPSKLPGNIHGTEDLTTEGDSGSPYWSGWRRGNNASSVEEDSISLDNSAATMEIPTNESHDDEDDHDDDHHGHHHHGHHYDLESFLYHKVALGIGDCFHFFIYPSGLISNSISLMVMTMKHNKQLTTCVFMSIIAVSDNLVLVRGVVDWLLEDYFPEAWNSGMCKADIFVHHCLAGFNAYTIVLMTFDKFCAIIYPHKSLVFTRKKIFLSTIVNVVTQIVLYFPLLFAAGFDPDDHHFCVKYKHELTNMTVYSVLSIGFYPTIPVAALFVMNISIIRAIFKRKVTTTANVKKRKVQERQITIMLLLVSVIFVVLLLPFQLVDSSFVGHDEAGAASALEAARTFFIFNTSYYLSMLNYAINFYLYLLSGSKFRNDLRMLFGCRKRDLSVHHDQSQSQGSSLHNSHAPTSSRHTQRKTEQSNVD